MTTTTTTRLRLLTGTAIAASAAFAVPAFAQDAEDIGGLQEIIVTAQKREQSLQDVPIAVTAVTGESLAANRTVTTSPERSDSASKSHVHAPTDRVGSDTPSRGVHVTIPLKKLTCCPLAWVKFNGNSRVL